MSSLYVRQLADTWAGTLGTPFYNTVNEEQNPADMVWLSIEYNAFATTLLTYCGLKEETGLINLVFQGPPGVSYADLMSVAEIDAADFFTNVDPTGRLTMEFLQAPVEFGGSDTPYFSIEFPINYTYRY